jgi:hypothetical protein
MTFFYDLNKKLAAVSTKPETTQLNERDMGKHNNKTTGFDALAKKAGKEYGSKAAGERVAGAQFQKMKKAGKLEETDIEEGILDNIKMATKKLTGGVNKAIGHGTDADMMMDLQKKMGVPQTGQKPQQPAQQAKEGVDKVAFAALAEPKDKITFADKIAGAKKEVDEMLGDVAAEAMRNALGGHKQETDEGWDDMIKDVKRRRASKVGDVERGHKHDIEHTATGRRVTRRTDDQGYSVGADDSEEASKEKRSVGRPKGAPKGPERVTAKATKHKGGRKVAEGADQAQQIYNDLADLRATAKQAQQGGKFPVGFASRLESTLWAAMTLIKNQQPNNAQVREEEIDEKAVSKKQQKFMGMVHATQKGEKAPSKEVAKVAKSMGKKDAEDFASTKHKGLPEKKAKKKDVEETTTSGSVAASTAAPAGKSNGVYGKGIYDSVNHKVENLIAESMSVNISSDSEGHKNITVTASDEDADKLASLLQMAGLDGNSEQGAEACSTCSSAPCGCSEVVDENKPDWPTNTETSADPFQYSGGLNKPKSTGQTTIPVIASQSDRQTSEEDAALRQMMERAGITQEGKKPDFLDVDKDGDKKESFKKAVDDKAEKKVEESIITSTANLWAEYKGKYGV